MIINRCLIPEVLSIYSNKPRIHYFSFAENFNDKLFNCNNYKLKINFYIRPKSYFQSLEKNNYTFYYSNEIKANNDKNIIHIFWKKRIYPFGNLYANMIIYQKDIYTLEVNKLYYDTIRFRIENILPPGLVLRDFVYLLLVLNGYLPLHSSSFAIDKERAFLVLAPPNVGKSYTVIQAVNDGFYILSEDISLVDTNGNVYAVLYTSTYIHEVSKLKYLSLLSYYISPKIKPIGIKYKNNILKKSKLKNIFILEYSTKESVNILKNKSVFLVDKESIINKILSLNREEFKIFSNKLMIAYFYLMNNITNFIKLEFNLINKLVENSENIVLLRASKPKSFYKIIKNMIY